MHPLSAPRLWRHTKAPCFSASLGDVVEILGAGFPSALDSITVRAILRSSRFSSSFNRGLRLQVFFPAPFVFSIFRGGAMIPSQDQGNIGKP